MSATKASRSDVAIHNSLTAFFNLQDGQKAPRQLYADVIQYVFTHHSVIWVEADVKSVLRAANNRGGAIAHETQLDVARAARYEEAMQYIADNSQTRTSAKRATADKQHIIDEYNKISAHTHMPLSMAQLALHRSLVDMSEKGKKIRADTEEEERRMQALIRQQKRDEAIAKSEQKAKAAADSVQKKREAAAEKAAKEAQKTKAINTAKFKALVEHNRDRYKRKREEGELKAEFMKLGLKVMRRMVEDDVFAEGEAVEEKENVAIDENKMPE